MDAFQARRAVVVALPAAVLMLAWSAPPKEVEHATGDTPAPRVHAGDNRVSGPSEGAAGGGGRRRFADLDAHLAWLRERAKLGGSWYREVRPGVYELQGGNLRLPDGDHRQRTFTREELAEKFGYPR